MTHPSRKTAHRFSSHLITVQKATAALALAPAGTPDAVINKIYEAVASATKDKKIQDSFIAQGAVAVGSTPAELDQVVKTEIPMWKDLAQKANIKLN